MTETLGYTGPAEALVGYYADRRPRPAMYQFRVSCRLCGGPLSEVLRLPDCPLANEYLDATRAGEKQDHFPVVIAQCAACAHVQTQTIVNPERLYSEYTYTSGVAASFKRHLESLATELHGAGHRSIVDIGSNDGTLLHYSRNLGMRGVGVDPARNLAAEASARGNLTFPAFFNVETAREIRKTIGAPDVVTCLNAFAHTDDLAAIAGGVRELIGETGEFVFEVAYLLDLLEKNEIGSLYHEHISSHHVEPLVRFFGERGLTLVGAERIAAQGGSIRCRVRARGSLAELGAVDKFCDQEDVALAGKVETWPTRVEAEREATMAELAPYLAPVCQGCGGNGGNHPSPTFNWHTHPGVKFGPCPGCQGGGKKPLGKLAIYGAPARLTTWAYAMGFKREDVTCVFDDEPRKVGRLTPGLQWPIVSSAELMARNPEAILIASWNYASEIRARFPGYQGRWIVPKRGDA